MNFIRNFYFLLFRSIAGHISKSLISLLILPSIVFATTNDTPQACYDLLPADATTYGSFYICRSRLNGKESVYACQNFISRFGYYRVFFKSGRFPKIIEKISKKGKLISVIWSVSNSTSQPEYNFRPPGLIPDSSRFIGAGVCKNEQDQEVPCSVFRFSAARYTEVKDYLVMYKKDGTGPDSQTAIALQPNHDAMPAEMAYQIGLNLLDTVCCQDRAVQYLEYAASLFPDSVMYKKALKQRQLKN
ncbi:MAG: hypothetical protein OEY29_05295 [Gammaproteobacteria bacterium]|nr:hypothetical protein [Gammaproteobacteria bacterium]